MIDLQTFLRQQLNDADYTATKIELGSARQPDSEREFVVTNGLGSYASAGIWGENTRKYHGLFVAALKPPVERTVMFSRVDEVITVGGCTTRELSTNIWRAGSAPEGYKLLTEFAIEPCPTWRFELPEGVLLKQLVMVPGKQQCVVGYTWLSDSGKSADLKLALMANYRSFHGETVGSDGWRFSQTASQHQVTVKAFDAAQGMTFRFAGLTYHEDPAWYWGYRWPRETERGLNDSEDCFRIGFAEGTLNPGQSLSIVAELAGQPAERVDASVTSINQAVKLSYQHQHDLLNRAGNPSDSTQRRLVTAADQLVVHRDSTDGASVIAGYHWFNDWGRDSMISLPGLTLSTGRFEVARSILSTFAKYESEGMLPNNFPDSNEAPSYNTSDATFWWAWALYQYHASTGDLQFVREQLPKLDDVVEWHKKGTRHKLRLDPADGLISGGEPFVQLTWMDAKVGNYVVTPRQGKAVEICALWYNFLRVLADLYRKCADADLLADREAGNTKAADYEALAAKAQQGMAQFWNADKGCLFDVINDDGTKDASVRPNQVIAVSLPFVAFSKDQASKILAVVEKELRTPFGLRTLSPADPAYKGEYGGGKAQANQYNRDVTYHQGTVWPWLLGPWVDACLYTYGESPATAAKILKQLEPLGEHVLAAAGVGSISEIFDGDAPFKPRGCVAQAWSVAELLRVRKRLIELSAAPQMVPASSGSTTTK